VEFKPTIPLLGLFDTTQYLTSADQRGTQITRSITLYAQSVSQSASTVLSYLAKEYYFNTKKKTVTYMRKSSGAILKIPQL